MGVESVAETARYEIFVDLQQYLYEFRVRSIQDDGMQGAFSSTTELYGEPVEKRNVTTPEGASILQTSEISSESKTAVSDEASVLKLGRDFPLMKRGNQAFVLLKTLTVSLELEVQRNFTIFHTWIHEALPPLRTAIANYFHGSAWVDIKNCELILSRSMRKYAALEVSVMVLPESSGAEYDHEVEQIFNALYALQGSASARLVQVFMSELRRHDVVVPDEFALILPANTTIDVNDIEFAVDVEDASGGTNSDGNLSCTGDLSCYSMFLIAASVVVFSILVICLLFRKYRQLLQVARELKVSKQEKSDAEKHASKQQHAQVMSDLEKQTEEVRNAREKIQHAREAIQHEKKQLVKDQDQDRDLQPIEADQVELTVECCYQLPTLLATPGIRLDGKGNEKQPSPHAKPERMLTNFFSKEQA